MMMRRSSSLSGGVLVGVSGRYDRLWCIYTRGCHKDGCVD